MMTCSRRKKLLKEDKRGLVKVTNLEFVKNEEDLDRIKTEGAKGVKEPEQCQAGGEEQEKDEQVMNVWVLEKMAKPKWRLLNARLKERDLSKFGSGNH